MAGHSQFKNIMYRKGAQDAKRSKLFSKLAREVQVSARMGTPDPEMNARLRAAIAAARAANMPKDNIERAIKRGTTGEDGANYEEVRYEGYGPAGVAVIVEALTDNRNRTAADVRSAFTKFGGGLGETGSVSFMFDRVGSINYLPDVANEDEMLEAAVEAGAGEVRVDVVESGSERSAESSGIGKDRAGQVRADAAIDVVADQTHPLHALDAPVRRLVGAPDIERADLVVVDAFKHPEEPAMGIVTLLIQIVDLNRQPAHRLVAVIRNEGLPARVFKERMIAGNGISAFHLQRRYPAVIIGIDVPGSGNEVLQPALGVNDLYSHGHGLVSPDISNALRSPPRGACQRFALSTYSPAEKPRSCRTAKIQCSPAIAGCRHGRASGN